MASGVHSLIWQCDEGVLEGRIAQAGHRVALLKARAQPSEMIRPKRVRGERAPCPDRFNDDGQSCGMGWNCRCRHQRWNIQ